MNPKVTAIIVTFNNENTLKEAIGSILNQTYQELELIVVNNGSTDNTPKVIASIKDPRLSLIDVKKNTGSPVAGRNMGIKAAKGELIGFCDDDDIWYPEKLEKLIDEYQKSKEKKKVGIVFSGTDIIDKDGKIIGTRNDSFDGFLPQSEAFHKMINGDFVAACSALFTKKAAEEAGPLNEKLVGVDEYDLWLRILKRYGILGVREPLCGWRKTATNMSENKKLQYLRTEKVLEEFKGPESESGKAKNKLRIFIAAVLEGDYKTAREYRKKISNTAITTKGKLLIITSKISFGLARVIFKLLESFGIISL